MMNKKVPYLIIISLHSLVLSLLFLILSLLQYNTGAGGLKSLAQIGLDQFRKQDGFESVMGFSLPWQDWRVPVCIAYDGLFIHEEIETGA